MRELTLERRLLGGLRLAPHKQQTTAQPIRRGFVPRELIIPLPDSPMACATLVAVGERVLRGQPLAAAAAGLASSHAGWPALARLSPSRRGRCRAHRGPAPLLSSFTRMVRMRRYR